MRIKPTSDRVTIVLLGQFVPALFQPAWFALHKMLGSKEAESANVEVIHPEITKFKVDQFELTVVPERFAVTSSDDHPIHIKDLVISCFATVLPQTPIKSMGINRDVHFDTGDFEVRDRVGSRLAPKEPWGAWGKQILDAPREPLAARGGMVSLVMQQGERPDGLKGRISAKVQPSGVIKDTGIFVAVNDHFDVQPENDDKEDASRAVAILEKHWDTSLERAAWIIDQLMALAEECRK